MHNNIFFYDPRIDTCLPWPELMNNVPLTTSLMPASSKFCTGQVKSHQSIWARKNFVLQNLNFQIVSCLQWKTTQHFKRVILLIPFCSSELRFFIQDFDFSLYASNESRFYIMHVYSGIQLEGFSTWLIKDERVPIFLR
jgi:hypothetical protein